jgi:hypothetical protein
MPWHVIVHHNKPVPEEPWPFIDRVIYDEGYPNDKAMLDAVSKLRKDLRATYPPPEYTVVTGSGPESDHPDYYSFVGWLLRTY